MGLGCLTGLGCLLFKVVICLLGLGCLFKGVICLLGLGLIGLGCLFKGVICLLGLGCLIGLGCLLSFKGVICLLGLGCLTGLGCLLSFKGVICLLGLDCPRPVGPIGNSIGGRLDLFISFPSTIIGVLSRGLNILLVLPVIPISCNPTDIGFPNERGNGALLFLRLIWFRIDGPIPTCPGTSIY